MATATIEVTLSGLTGFTLTCDLYPRGSDTAAVSGLALTEATNRKCTYTTTTTAGLTGWYLCVVKEGTTVRGTGMVLMSDDTSVHIVSEGDPATSTGTGPYTVVVKVTDGTNPLQNAVVRLTLNPGNYYTGTGTDVNGLETFNIGAGTYTVAISCGGYTFAGDTYEVTGDTADPVEFAMTIKAAPAPSDPSLSTGSLTVLGTDGLPEQGVEIYVRYKSGSGDAGFAYSSSITTLTSDVDGLVSIELVKGATCEAKRGDSRGGWIPFTVPSDSDAFNLPEIIGAP